MPRNEFESLRRPGIVGEVVGRDFSSLNIFQCGAFEAVTVYSGQLLPDVWAFGYLIVDGDFTARVLPGELDGWFKSETDARLYALGYLRNAPHISQNAREEIIRHIRNLRNTPLFD